MLPLEVPSSLPGINREVFVPPDSALRPKGLHRTRGVAASGFRHCAKFPTAASRRSLDRVSVPVWLIILSDQLPVLALVSRYLTNKLIGRDPIPKWQALSGPHLFSLPPKRLWSYPVLARLSACYPELKG